MLSMTIFPQIAILGALYTMINRAGLYNSLGSLIFSYAIFTLPFTVWVLTSFMRALPKDLEEAAYIDGASTMQVFYRVMLPLLAPALVTTGHLAFIAAWNEFLYALVTARRRSGPFPWRSSTSRASPEAPFRHPGARSWPPPFSSPCRSS